jgi:putative DNA primase/helicase
MSSFKIPEPPPATLDHWPEELKLKRQYVLYEFRPREMPKKLKRYLPVDSPWHLVTKVPLQLSGSGADTTNPEHWTHYLLAVARQNGFAGIGCVAYDDLVFMDLDDCVNPDTGCLEDWAEDVIDATPTYWELSPSKTGLHGWAWGKLPESRRRGQMEMYSAGRFGTVTGWHLPGTPSTVAHLDLEPLHKRMCAGEFEFENSPIRHAVAADLILTNNYELLKAGRYPECLKPDGSRYASHSEGDLALLNYLKHEYSTPAEIDRAFRQTGMMRDKWDSPRGSSTYGQQQIQKVLKDTHKEPAGVLVNVICHPSQIPDPRGIESPPVQYLAEGLIPANQLVVIPGEPSVGKTFFAMLLAAALLKGQAFLGREVQQRQNVVFFDRENPLAIIKERLSSIFDEQEPCYSHWGVWAGDEPPNLSSERYLEFAKLPGAVLIFDSLTRFHGADENSPTEMARIFALLRKMQAAGASVIVLHHRDKRMQAPYRGASEILAGCDAMYALSREKEQGDLRSLRLIKSRCALDEHIQFRCDWEIPAIVAVENQRVVKRRELAGQISTLLASQPAGVQQAVLFRQLKSDSVSERLVRRVLDQHEGKRWLSTGGGRGVPKFYRPRVTI